SMGAVRPLRLHPPAPWENDREGGTSTSFEALGVYESWSASQIRGDRWSGVVRGENLEITRAIKFNATTGKNELRVRLRGEGDTAPNSGGREGILGLLLTNGALPFTNAAAVNEVS